jgi:hypothetical protein
MTNSRANFTEANKDEFSEGGKGWLVVIGCVCSIQLYVLWYGQFFGAFQTPHEAILFSDIPRMKVSIIGACQANVIYIRTPLAVLPVFTFGVRRVLASGASLTVIAMFGSSTTLEGQL